MGVNVVGVVPSPFTVNLAVNTSLTTASTGGNLATGGNDYTLTSSTISIPAGDYGLGRTFDVALTFNDDTVIENNETLTLSIPTPANPVTAPYVIANTTICGNPPNREATITIHDNDIDLLTTKSVSTATPLYGTAFTYNVAYTNNTGRPTVAPLTTHDVTTAITDPVPSGLTFSAWTCTASGTTGTACPASSGTGPITGNAVLPAGGTVTYAVTATLAGRICDPINNTSTISVPSGFTEGTSVQSGFTSPTPPSPPSSNNTASASVTPKCTDLRISKSNTSTPTNRLDLPTDTVTSGLTTTYTLLVENGTPAVSGAVIKDTVGSGLNCPSTATVTCNGSNASICPSATYTVANLTGAGITLGNMPANSTATLTFSCTVN